MMATDDLCDWTPRAQPRAALVSYTHTHTLTRYLSLSRTHTRTHTHTHTHAHTHALCLSLSASRALSPPPSLSLSPSLPLSLSHAHTHNQTSQQKIHEPRQVVKMTHHRRHGLQSACPQMSDPMKGRQMSPHREILRNQLSIQI